MILSLESGVWYKGQGTRMLSEGGSGLGGVMMGQFREIQWRRCQDNVKMGFRWC